MSSFRADTLAAMRSSAERAGRSVTTNATVERARQAAAVAFVANGLAFGSWASRTPAVKDGLDLDASGLGIVLMCISIGSVAGLPLAGAVVHRLSPARALAVGAVIETLGILVSALGLASVSRLTTGGGLVLFGLGHSLWDIAMNVEAADVERRLGRTIMARFHAAWSLGTVLGAAAGAAAAGQGVGVPTQLLATALVIAVAATSAARFFVPAPARDREGRSLSLLRDAWLTRRTLLIGVMVLAFAFTEGVANDWTAVAVVDGLGASQAVGALGLGIFVSAMTVARLVGGSAVDRWGRVIALRASAAVAAAGVLLVILAPTLTLALVGSMLWGFGAALGFPTGMSSAADGVQGAALHVSVVGSIGYTAFLAGPPFIGMLADAVGIRPSLYVVLGALLLAMAVAGSCLPPGPVVETVGGPSHTAP